MPLEERTVVVAGRRVRYRETGRGTPVVLVHGLSGSWRWWRDTLAALAERHRVLLVDLPGFGSVRSRRLALPEAAEWLAVWLAAAGLERPALVGHSMGGLVCAQVAARHPGAAGALVLVSPAGVPSGRSFAGHALPLFAAFRQAPMRFRGLLVVDAFRAGPRTVVQAARELLAEDVRPDLRSVDVPTLLVWGERDPVLPPALADEWSRELPHAPLAMLPEAGHVPMVDRPAELTAAVVEFLESEL